jgi:hypothetical protein
MSLLDDLDQCMIILGKEMEFALEAAISFRESEPGTAKYEEVL